MQRIIILLSGPKESNLDKEQEEHSDADIIRLRGIMLFRQGVSSVLSKLYLGFILLEVRELLRFHRMTELRLHFDPYDKSRAVG